MYGISDGMCLSKTEMSFVNRNSSSVGETSKTSFTFPRRRNFGSGAGGAADARVMPAEGTGGLKVRGRPGPAHYSERAWIAVIGRNPRFA